jgi:muramoyltetrapeptide carboxypeptidase LdcA involved in peptidoglycan recycling
MKISMGDRDIHFCKIVMTVTGGLKCHALHPRLDAGVLKSPLIISI